MNLIFAAADSGSSTMEMLTGTALRGLNILGSLFLFVLGILAAIIIVTFIIDVTQTKDTVRRNYPVLGRFRSLFSMFPKLEGTHSPHAPFIIGKDSQRPYAPTSLFNISAMSYGSLSKPAIQALSHGAQMAGCWLNTGEGGVSPYHLEGECDIIFQLGTGKFGARNEDGTLNAERLRKTCEDNPDIKMIEIKISQGAKPGRVLNLLSEISRPFKSSLKKLNHAAKLRRLTLFPWIAVMAAQARPRFRLWIIWDFPFAKACH